ncbi:hypothetical protein Q0Z83_060670 [Actinoplanes sichuanensis]|uniref:Helix-turn-helix domain-containing protein n=1 Tax=Actinoplanes sichuanensis TaxID=512349 RepID=A0ABW4A5X6_9ACTN|nr:helix-turn-helix transcriptional regulator [Actinoplanes sichuanensis]BEL07876.1 hypothetical protein Q0Z83_060670 [Actinoplanes sichuanensis]
MDTESPRQLPEGRLLHDAQKASGLSIYAVAERAGMSDARWRQIVKGSMSVQGVVVPVVANAKTLARMARAVGLGPDDLIEAGRDDAAETLRATVAVEGAPIEEPEGAAIEELEGAATETVTQRPVQVGDAIEMIYGSKSMTAEQKLDAIRRVLQLHAEIDARTGNTATFQGTGALTAGRPEEN